MRKVLYIENEYLNEKNNLKRLDGSKIIDFALQNVIKSKTLF